MLCSALKAILMASDLPVQRTNGVDEHPDGKARLPQQQSEAAQHAGPAQEAGSADEPHKRAKESKSHKKRSRDDKHKDKDKDRDRKHHKRSKSSHSRHKSDRKVKDSKHNSPAGVVPMQDYSGRLHVFKKSIDV